MRLAAFARYSPLSAMGLASARALQVLRTRFPRGERAALGLALALVLAVVSARLLLQPIFGSNHAYTVFYPAVILATYFAGRRAGVLTTALSATAAYAMFVEPALLVKTAPTVLGPLLFFTANASVAVYLISGLTDRLDRIALAQERAETAARDHADLFRELNERVTHHLQLVSGVLALSADRHAARDVARALAKASETSLLLARVHRDVAGRAHDPVDFKAFAHQLIEATLSSRGLSPDLVELSGERLLLAPDKATSLAVALLECLTALLDRDDPSRLSLQMSRDADHVALRIILSDGASERDAQGLATDYFLRTVIEQLGARVYLNLLAQEGALEFRFPISARVPSGSEVRTSLLH